MKNTNYFILNAIRLISIMFFVLVLFYNVKGQTELPSTKFTAFSYSPGLSSQQADQVGRMVEGYFTNAKRFTMITTDDTEIRKELDRQKDGFFLDGYMVEQNRGIGARYLVVGHLININDGLDYATIQLGVVDVETGESVVAETLSPQGRSAATLTILAGEVIPTQVTNPVGGAIVTKIITQALKKRLEKNVMDFLDEHFPMNFLMTRMDENAAKIISVELYGYKKHQFRKNDTFKVIQKIRREIPGTKEVAIEKIEIATLTVKEVKGDFAECTVSKQEQEKLYEYKDAAGITVIKK